MNSTIHAWIQWCFVGFEQFPKETRFKSLIENICIGLGSTAKVIYISTNTSDQMSVNATVFTPLRGKTSHSRYFFSVEQAKPTEELSETYKLEFRKGDNFRSILTKMP